MLLYCQSSNSLKVKAILPIQVQNASPALVFPTYAHIISLGMIPTEIYYKHKNTFYESSMLRSYCSLMRFVNSLEPRILLEQIPMHLPVTTFKRLTFPHQRMSYTVMFPLQSSFDWHRKFLLSVFWYARSSLRNFQRHSQRELEYLRPDLDSPPILVHRSLQMLQ